LFHHFKAATGCQQLIHGYESSLFKAHFSTCQYLRLGKRPRRIILKSHFQQSRIELVIIITILKNTATPVKAFLKTHHFVLLNRILFRKFNSASAFPVATRPERHDLSSSTSLVDKSRRQVFLQGTPNQTFCGISISV
jgi:hypothetical protein